jgi:hypothetical protein
LIADLETLNHQIKLYLVYACSTEAQLARGSKQLLLLLGLLLFQQQGVHGPP